MLLRKADITEAHDITALINVAFGKAESFLVDGDRITLQAVEALFAKGEFLVLEEEGMLSGCVYVEPRGERSYLGLLSIRPELQRRGLGSRVMDFAEEYRAQAGCRFMDLQIVNVRLELPSFYERRGYAARGTAPFPSEYNPKVPCHFVKMSKPLK